MSSKYERDNSYRERFIEAHPPHNGKYRCVYCGRKINKDDMQVDHVIAVGRVKRNWLYRLCLPDGVNDLSNLVPSCRKCNHRKGSKGGLWAIRGHFWKIALPIYVTLKILLVLIIASISLILLFGFLNIGPFPDLLEKMTSYLYAIPKILADLIYNLLIGFFDLVSKQIKNSFSV